MYLSIFVHFQLFISIQIILNSTYFNISTLHIAYKILIITLFNYSIISIYLIFSIDEPILSSSSIKNLNKNATINDKTPSVAETDFDDPMATVNDINSEISNDDCLSQSPLNLTRSQGLFSSISNYL